MNKFLVFGDFTTEGKGKKSIEVGKAFDGAILDDIAKADYSIINLESPIVDESCQPIDKYGPNLCSSPIVVDFFDRIGISGITLANNHFYDYGERGVKVTIESLIEKGIQYVGGGRCRDEIKKILYITLSEAKIAVLNYCEHEYSIQDSIGSNPLNPISIYYDLLEARKNADIIICITHGGHEGYNLPSPRMQSLYRFIIDCGADAVVNHHQHCYSGYEQYHNGYIYYGLGNFFFDTDTEWDKLWAEGYYVSIQIENKKIQGITIHPYVQGDNPNFHVRPMDDSERNEFEISINKLNKIISDSIQLDECFRDFCKRKKKNYTVVLSPYTNRILRALSKRSLLPSFITKGRKKMLENYIKCEAHRDVLEYVLTI